MSDSADGLGYGATHLTFAQVMNEIANTGVSAPLVRSSLERILAGDWTVAQVAAFAVALRLSGETPLVLAAAAHALRSSMIAVQHDLPAVLDTCGTGGDGRGTMNVSTAASIIVAACGVPVAKHGNRAMSSHCGSADVLEALGIPLDVPVQRHSHILRGANITFMFAPQHHPAMRHAAQARRELGIRTFFNLLGPLANPAGATHQLLGTGEQAAQSLLADTLKELGTERSWVVCCEDGMDEISPACATRVIEISSGQCRTFSIVPEAFGVPRTTAESLAGGSAAHNAAALQLIFAGEPHPASTGIVLNAAAALVIARDLSLRDAALMAERALSSGAAAATLARWREAARAARDNWSDHGVTL